MKINQTFEEFFKSVDGLRSLVRYQTAPRIHSESVAEHSFFVAAYICKLRDYFKFDFEKAISIALMHDYTEVFISDVPHPIKAQHPELSEYLEKAEYKINCEKLSEEYAKGLEEFNHCTTPEGLVIALSDVLSVVSYSRYEVNLGNKDYMLDVYDGVIDRYLPILHQLKAFEKFEGASDQLKDEIEAAFKTRISN